MTQYKLTSILILALAVALPSAAATGRDAITTAQIAAAISGAGMATSAEQVTLLTGVMAKSSTPVLKVQSIEPWGGHRMKVRLDCANSEVCLPFYVAVRSNLESAEKSFSVAPVQSPSSAEKARVRTDPRFFVVRAGSLAVLSLDGNHVHIRLPVVCLESGAIGQTIRVASKDHRQTYTAEVFNGGELRVRL